MRYIEIRRHTDNDGDRLTDEGVEAARRIGREALHPPYAMFVSTGARRATEMAEILRAAAGQTDLPVVEEPHLRSAVEDRWRAAAKAAGSSELEAIRRVDPDLVEKETRLLGSVLRSLVQQVPDGNRILVIGHSPTSEAAVLGLTGHAPAPLGKGEGVLVVEDAGRFTVEPLR